ncbi:MAG: ATP-binding protein [Bacteroidaceae bacterium]
MSAVTYSDVIGQQEIKQHLQRMVREGRMPHALMITGREGAGAMPLALALARHLLCEHPLENGPCETCASCRMTADWAHPDQHFSFPVYKAKSTDKPTSVDYMPQWREQLQQSIYFDAEMWLADIKAGNQQMTHYVQESDRLQQCLSLKPSQGGRRVVLQWLPELMDAAPANKLLKLIEEPPERTHFILVSLQPEQVLGTIQSRVQRITLPPLAEEEIAQVLMQREGVAPEQAREMARVVQGNYTEALKQVQAKGENQEFNTYFMELMRLCYARKIKELRQWSLSVSAMGRERQKRMLAHFQHLLRENFIYNFHVPALTYQTREERQFSERFAPFINERNVIGIMDEMSQAQRDIEQNVNPKMVFFVFALKMIILIRQ